MLAFLTASGNVAFASALLLMLLIAIVQLAGLGDFGIDADADVELDADGAAGPNLLGWLGFGRLPLMMLLVLFLAIFGGAGLIVQQLMLDATGALLPGWIAAPAVALGALPATGAAANLLGRMLPRDHSTAVPLDVLVGRSAQIVTGRATQGSPARARAEDQYGQAHYVMVEPDGAGQRFEEGERVLLVRREADVFRAVSRGDHHLPRL